MAKKTHLITDHNGAVIYFGTLKECEAFIDENDLLDCELQEMSAEEKIIYN